MRRSFSRLRTGPRRMSGRPLIVQQICGHAVQSEFDGAPLGHHTVQNPIKGGAVIMLQKVGPFMEQDVIHTFARRLDERRVEYDRSIDHAVAPLSLNASQNERRTLGHPVELLRQRPSGKLPCHKRTRRDVGYPRQPHRGEKDVTSVQAPKS